MSRVAIIGVTLLAWSLSSADAFACPMCKLALESDDPQPRAYMLSILFMLGMITSVTGAVGALLWYVNRIEKRMLEAAGYHHVLQNAVNAPPRLEAQG
ncbi:MAG: hypothetical protein SFV23_19430 [Planctomycetaceae bacterium]|nr:hypothetical protein [Planctomycetaceae bacterium]